MLTVKKYTLYFVVLLVIMLLAYSLVHALVPSFPVDFAGILCYAVGGTIGKYLMDRLMFKDKH